MIGKVEIYRSGGHDPLNCKLCRPLECQADYHEAAQNIHAYLRSLVNRNWVKDMAKAKAEAKKLHKAHHSKPDYRTEEQRQRILGGRRGGLAAGEVRIKSTEPRVRPSRAAYMRQYRKAHAEPRSMTPAEAGRKGGRASGVVRRMGKHGL